MRSWSMMLCLAGLILVVGLTLALGNREAVSAVKPQTTQAPSATGSASYRHQSHFLTSIQLTGSDTFSNVVSVDNKAAAFTGQGGASATWELYSQKLSKSKKKLILVFVAKKASNPGNLDPQVAGTGSILITTTDPGSSLTTTTTVPVEPIDTDPCP